MIIFFINFKDYFWDKYNDLHERYHLKRITMTNVIEFFNRMQESMSNFAKDLNSLITKDYILYPEKSSTKYEAMEFIKLILTIQSTQLNVGVEIIKKRILDTIKVEKEEEIKEKELYSDLKKLINKYEESKSSLIKSKEKFYQSAKNAEASVWQAKEFELKQKEKEIKMFNININNANNNINDININNSNNNNKINNNDSSDLLIKMEQKYLENLIEAKKNDDKYLETLKETNNIRELVNNKQKELLKFYENIENKDHQLYLLILRDYYSFLKTDNSIIKGNLIQLEDKINKIDYNKDIISLINIYGSEKKPKKSIKYEPYKPGFDMENPSDENEILFYQIIVSMKPFIRDFCKNFDLELETKKKNLKELLQIILSKNDNINFTEENKKKLLEFISEEWGQKYFLYFLSKVRATGNFRRTEELVKYLAEIFKNILFYAEKNLDYEAVKNCIILSQTYYYEDQNKLKIYLVDLISENKWLKTPDFWRNIIDIMIKEDIEKLKKINQNNPKMIEKIEKESITNIVFGQVISYINNMKDFNLEKKTIVKIVDEFVEKYNIKKELSKNIYDNIGNEKEIEELRKEYKDEDKNVK